MNVDERKRSFDRIAASYASHRPGYPPEAFDQIERLSGIRPPAELLEIACGPGQATLPLAQRGFRLHAIELGEHLAELARQRVAGFPVRIEVGPFEQVALPESAYDLAVCASAFHWLDRPLAYQKLAQALRPGGAVALMWNFQDREAGDDGFFAAVRECYQRFAPALMRAPGEKHLPYRVRDAVGEELVGSGHFRDPVRWQHRWERTFGADAYLDLLGTYSDHLALAPEARASLFECIRQVVLDQFNGRITRHFVTDLIVARRGGPSP